MTLKDLRMSVGLTQEDVGHAVGVGRTAVAMWESGNSFPRSNDLPILAKLYKTTVDVILSCKFTRALNTTEEGLLNDTPNTA